jgi:predicted nucleic acid-binding protein
MIIVDTDVIVDVTRGHPPTLHWLATVSTETLAISGFSVFELLAGCRNGAEQQRVDRTLNRFNVVWPSTAHCSVGLQTYRSLSLSTGISAFDILIGQTAVELGLPLHTSNVKHFRHVPGLTTIQPYTK